jgi:predicted glycosyltransferase
MDQYGIDFNSDGHIITIITKDLQKIAEMLKVCGIQYHSAPIHKTGFNAGFADQLEEMMK